MDTIATLAGKLAEPSSAISNYGSPQANNAAAPRETTMKERMMESVQRIAALENQVTELSQALERLAHLCQTQVGLEL